MPIEIDNLLSSDGVIARRLPHFESRPQQQQMASAVESALAGSKRLLVEAGTGVGKSFAYLIPAIQRVVDHGERVVIATNTISLQEQLIEKDIPLLNAVIPDEFTAVLVKGRGNYASLRRLKLASERQDRLFGDEESRHSLHMIEDWAYTTNDGSLATLPQLSRPSVWDYAQSDAHNCMGRKCPTYQKCFFQAARRRMENGQLLICNHALFFSDLALRMQGVGLLPAYNHVILDEAHGVEDVAADHFGISLAETRVLHLLNLLYHPRHRGGFLATFQTVGDATSRVDRAIEQTLRCRNACGDFFAQVEAWRARDAGPSGRMLEPNVVENTLSEPMGTLADQLKLLREYAANEADALEMNSYHARAVDIARSATALLEQRIDGCVYFVETPPPKAGRPQRRPVMRAMAVNVAPILEEHLFGREGGVILTSATLATGEPSEDGSEVQTTANRGPFAHIARRLGCESAETLQLGSPFNFARQMRIAIDRTMPDPGAPTYVDALVPRIERLVRESDGGAFILFTSFKMLNEVSRQLRPVLLDDGFPVLVHGADGPPGLLLRRFREDTRSVLFGTASFWQGVDVRGEGLRTVIITRLPFEVPDRPIVEARHDQIREGGGRPFRDDQLPRAIIRFRQGVGRLIRSEDDRGTVAVLDPRIVTKSYGRMFRGALPEGVEVIWMDEEGGARERPEVRDVKKVVSSK